MRFNQQAKAVTLLLTCMVLFGCAGNGGLKRWGQCALGGAGIGGGVGGIVGSSNHGAGALAGAAGGALLGGLICAFTEKGPEPAPRAAVKETAPTKDTLVLVEPTPVPVPVAEKLETVYFATGSDKLDAKAKRLLEDLATKAKANNILDLTVVGYTDNMGESKGYDNLALSKRREESVRQYLESLGVSAKRMDNQPGGVIQQGNHTREGRAKNRKAVIIGTLAKEKPEGH